MRALAAGAFGLLVISRAFAATADVVVHLFPAPNSARAVQMNGVGFGDIWFAQPEADSLARVNPDGSITERPVAPGSRPLAIAREESFSSVIFTEVDTNRIGLMDDDGVVTEFDIPTPASDPRGITVGPSGASGPAIWFTEFDGNRIGRLEPSSATPIVEFPIPTFNSGPLGIAQGPGVTAGSTDIWFTEYLANKIGRIDANGVITEYLIPTPDSGPTAIVQGIVANQAVMYFTESKANRIGRITASGRITEYVIPTPNSGPADIVADNFEGVWFSERLAGKLAWLDEDGGFREFPLPANSRPEGISLDYEVDFFQPPSVWYVDGTHRRVGRLSGNRLFAVGAGHGVGWDTDFELSNPDDGAGRIVELGVPVLGPCPTICPHSVFVEVPPNGTAGTSASLVPMSEGDRLYLLTGLRPSISDVPDTRAWIVGALTGDLRVELPLMDYWTLVTLQPPLPRGGPQPALTFAARRRAHVRTELVLSALEADEPEGLAVLLEALTPEGDVLGAMPLQLPVGELIVLDRVLSDLGVFDDFEGHLRVTRVARSGLFWGVVKIYENNRLTRVLAPESELDPECLGGPARCGPPRRTRVVTRQSGLPIRDESALRPEKEGDRDR
jgi:virginiamycin B lyase